LEEITEKDLTLFIVIVTNTPSNKSKVHGGFTQIVKVNNFALLRLALGVNIPALLLNEDGIS